MTGSENNLHGKNALVVGATSGIGLQIARDIAASGCNLGIIGLGDLSDIKQLLAEIRDQSGTEAAYFDADLREPDRLYTAIDTLRHDIGELDILINSAGIQHVAPVQNYPVEKWNEIMAVNLSAVFHATKAVLPGMVAKSWGRIVNICSTHGLVGSANKSAYVAAKHGVVGLTKVVAIEHAQDGVTCNAVCPGFVDTDLVRQQIHKTAETNNVTYQDAQEELISNKHPSGRFIRTDDISSLVLFLCSEAGAGMTGAAIPIDGGWTAL